MLSLGVESNYDFQKLETYPQMSLFSPYFWICMLDKKKEKEKEKQKSITRVRKLEVNKSI